MRRSKRRLIASLAWATFIIVLAATTFLTSSNPYGQPWFAAMMCAAGAALAVSLFRSVRHRRTTSPGSMVLHAGLLTVLVGGGLTAFGGERGQLVLAPSPGMAATSWLLDDGSATRPLPLPMSLDSFIVRRHAAMASPSDYVSYLTVGTNHKQVCISVNHPARFGSHRFYQASYGADGSTVLIVDYDPWHGREVVYFGFLLVASGFIILLYKSSRRQCGRLRVLVVSAMTGALSLQASAGQTLPPHTDLSGLDTLQVMYHGRVAPFSTVATELMRSLSGPGAPSLPDAMWITSSIARHPEQWAQVPLIYVDDTALRDTLGMAGDMIAPSELFDSIDGSYRLATIYHGTDKGLDRAIAVVDSRVASFREAAGGNLWQPLPHDAPRLPVWRISLERFYTGVPMRRISFILFLAAGLLALAAAATPRKRYGGAIALCGLCAAGAWGVSEIAMRWVIGGIAPVSSGSDALTLVAVMLIVAAIILQSRYHRLTASLTALTGGFASLVAWLGQPVSVIVPVMPVLASPWLAIHVTLVMSAYSLLAVTSVIAAVNLFAHASSKRTEMILKILPVALFLLAAGIMTGAIWAGDSWGRYWAWDPKETWALITLLAYAYPLHFPMRRQRLDIYILAAFLTVIMTYWGVNYLPSLHAYQ